MDKTASKDKILLGYNHKCCKDTALLCNYNLLLGNKLKVDRSIYEILQILSFSLFDKSPVNEMLNKSDCKNVKELNYKQLEIKWI